MKLTNNELKVIEAVFEDILRNENGDIHQRFGSLTIEAIQNIHSKIHYNEYCERHGISYEEMTDEDYEEAYSEEWDA